MREGLTRPSAWVSRPSRVGFLRLIVALELFALSALLSSLVVNIAFDANHGTGQMLPVIICSSLFLLSTVAGGVAGAVSLWRFPAAGSRGRWMVTAAAVNVLFLPLAWLLSWPATSVGAGFHVSWGPPYIVVWAVSGVTALLLAFSPEGEKSRVIPVGSVLAGGAVFTFFLGDMVPMP